MSQDDFVIAMNTSVLLLLLLISLVGNSLLIVVSATSPVRSAFNTYITSMAAFGLFECTFTMSLATGFSIEKSWIYGEFLKGFNCCCTQLQNIGMLLTVTMMAADRYFVICRYYGRRQVSMKYTKCAVFYAWLHAFAISSPLLFPKPASGIRIAPYVQRSLCGLSHGTTPMYIISLVITSIGLPIAAALFCFVSLCFTTYKLKINRNHCEGNGSVDKLSQMQSVRAYYVAALFLIFLLLKLPYVLVDISSKFSGTAQAKSSSWPHFQTVLVWIMFGFSALFPVITFAWLPEMKDRLDWCFACKKKKQINTGASEMREYDSNSGSTTNSIANQDIQQSDTATCSAERDFDRPIQRHHHNVPVLFATINGLHLMQPGRKIHLREPVPQTQEGATRNCNQRNHAHETLSSADEISFPNLRSLDSYTPFSQASGYSRTLDYFKVP